jgi:putative hydrolase of the HAD superfamily
MIKGVIFDFDNTLYNYDMANNFALKAVFNNIFEKFNIGYKTTENSYLKINKQIKNSNNSSNKFNKPIYFKKLFEDLNIPLKHLNECLSLYNSTFMEQIKLHDGVVELFHFLKSNNIKIGILSNNVFLQQYVKLLDASFIEYIDVVQTSDECGEEKPNKFMFLSIQNKMQIPFENLACVGDNYEHDIEPSIELGMLPFWFNESNEFKLLDKVIYFGSFIRLLTFFKNYFKTVDELVFLSKYFGQSVLNVQGPGGNISVKMDDFLFIKSSGSILGNMSYTDGYCIVDKNECNKMVKEDLNKIKDAKVYGFKTPSMETYFHSFMKKHVVHLHFVLSNIFLCSKETTNFDGFELSYKIIDYCEPGLKLAREIQKSYNNSCDIYFLKNHGLIITGETCEKVLKYYDYIFSYFNKKLESKYDDEIMCNGINSIYHANNHSKVVKKLTIQSDIFENMIMCFPDLAIFVQKKGILNSLIELENNFDNYDLITCEKKVFVIADNITKLYSLIEILESYYILLSSSKTELQTIDKIRELQNMEEEKLRRL